MELFLGLAYNFEMRSEPEDAGERVINVWNDINGLALEVPRISNDFQVQH